jgi:hypothetical protein
MICFLCKQAITTDQQVEHHHPIYKSEGGTQTAPTHKACHRNFHQSQGDFVAWGKLGGSLSALTRVWSINLKHVNRHPAFAMDRAFYIANYAR